MSYSVCIVNKRLSVPKFSVVEQVLKLLRHEMEAVRKKAVGAMHRYAILLSLSSVCSVCSVSSVCFCCFFCMYYLLIAEVSFLSPGLIF